MEACLSVYDVHLALGQPSTRPPEESNARCAVIDLNDLFVVQLVVNNLPQTAVAILSAFSACFKKV